MHKTLITTLQNEANQRLCSASLND